MLLKAWLTDKAMLEAWRGLGEAEEPMVGEVGGAEGVVWAPPKKAQWGGSKKKVGKDMPVNALREELALVQLWGQLCILGHGRSEMLTSPRSPIKPVGTHSCVSLVGCGPCPLSTVALEVFDFLVLTDVVIG